MDNVPLSPGSSSSSSVAEPDVGTLQDAVRNTNTLPAHITLINALRQTADLTRLREAVQAAYALYPLPESVWLNYLTDETPLATTSPTRQQLLSLHNQALADFSTPRLHAQRLIFAAQLLEDHEINEDVYKSFVEDAKQLGAGYNEDFKKLCEGLPQVPTIFVKSPSEAAIFEKRVLETPRSEAGTADESRITAYSFYARFAESYPSLAISIYETALSEAFFSLELWKQYDQFLCNTNNPLRNSVLQRACRVLPNELDLWRRAVTVSQYEEFLQLLDSVKPFVMQSHDLSSACRLTKEVWNKFFAFGCPAKVLQRVIGTLEFNVPESVEWASAVCHAAGVLFACGNSEMGENLMDDVVGIRVEARWWLLYAGLVREEKRRSVYEHALRSVGSLVEVYVIRDAWEIFEISCGGDGIVERMQTIAEAFMIREGERMKTDEGRKKISRERRHGKRAKRRRAEPSGQPDPKSNPKPKPEEHGEIGSDEVSKAVNGVDKMDEDDKDTSKPNTTNTGHTKQDTKPGGKKGGLDGVEPRTIFLNNLPFSVTEGDLQDEFSFAGTIKQIRLPKRTDGAAKGIAYIEFEDDEGVEKALLKHNKPVKGRAVWVRRSKPPVRKVRRGGGTVGRGRGGGGGSGRGRGRGGGRRIVIHAADREGDGDVVMNDRKGGLGQDDFRKMLE